MSDKYRIDSHKLIFHTKRVSDWLDGGDISPIYVEIATAGRCGHRCIFCAFDYLNYKGAIIEKDVLLGFLSESAELGVKSVMYAGEGEPLMHPNIGGIINETRKIGIDVAVTTNGVAFNENLARQCIKDLSWIKFSLDAASAGTYSKIHGCKEKDFYLVVRNIERAVVEKLSNNSLCRIGVQMLLIPENQSEMYYAAVLAKSIGADYFVVKPFTAHPMSDVRLSGNVDYDSPILLEEKALRLATDKFDVVIRRNTMQKVGHEKSYEECFGYRFWAYLDSSGNLYSCSAFLGDENYCYGNIYKQSFDDIWKSDRRKAVIKRMPKVDVSKCREICRLDEINKYLWELKHPSPHVNFL